MSKCLPAEATEDYVWSSHTISYRHCCWLFIIAGCLLRPFFFFSSLLVPKESRSYNTCTSNCLTSLVSIFERKLHALIQFILAFFFTWEYVPYPNARWCCALVPVCSSKLPARLCSSSLPPFFTFCTETWVKNTRLLFFRCIQSKCSFNLRWTHVCGFAFFHVHCVRVYVPCGVWLRAWFCEFSRNSVCVRVATFPMWDSVWKAIRTVPCVRYTYDVVHP